MGIRSSYQTIIDEASRRQKARGGQRHSNKLVKHKGTPPNAGRAAAQERRTEILGGKRGPRRPTRAGLRAMTASAHRAFAMMESARSKSKSGASAPMKGKTGKTARTRKIGKVARKVQARTGVGRKAARAKARKIVKRRGR